jgi:toxin ParE1/3/4
MAYRVELTARASQNLRRISRDIDTADSEQARAWFIGLEAAVLSLDEHSARSPVTPEYSSLRHLLYGRRRHVYRIIYTIDERSGVVTVLHIRHGPRQPFARPGAQ